MATLPPQVTTVNQVPDTLFTTNWNIAVEQSQIIRSSYLQYLTTPVSDLNIDNAIRQQYINNIIESDDQAISIAINSSAEVRDIVKSILSSQAYRVLSEVSNG